MDTHTLKSGTEVTLRPIRPEDEPKLVRFHDRIGEQSVYMRYASFMKQEQRVAHERLSRICFINYDREMALVAETPDEEIIGAGRITKHPGRNDAEFAMLVADDYQGEGIGTELLRRLVQVGTDENLDRITADILRRKTAPCSTCAKKLGFDIIYAATTLRDEMVKAVKPI